MCNSFVKSVCGMDSQPVIRKRSLDGGTRPMQYFFCEIFFAANH